MVSMTTSRWLVAASALLLVACDGLGPSGDDLPDDCSIPASLIFDGGPGKDGIPALTDPRLVGPADPGASYLLPDDRVIGLDLAGEQLAVPLNILWWHEIVNMRVGGRTLAVTHCPLTGSSLVFDREPLGGVEFGVSGLLYMNNLLMYDRATQESLWPQMSRGARCGVSTGTELTMTPAVEMTWAAWRELHPDTRVISSETGHTRDYQRYPYGGYATPTNPELLFPVPGGIDPRRPPKERVLGIPSDDGGIAFPFGEVHGSEAFVAEAEVDGRVVVVFGLTAAGAAMAFRAEVAGEPVRFEVDGTRIVDEATGSVWRVDGVAVEGPHTGRRLEPVAEAYVAYWFAWAAFHPQTRLWEET
jgi:hypothetical protein